MAEEGTSSPPSLLGVGERGRFGVVGVDDIVGEILQFVRWPAAAHLLAWRGGVYNFRNDVDEEKWGAIC